MMIVRSEPHFFGRRKGKTLRSRQAALTESLLPDLRVDIDGMSRPNWAKAAPYDDLWLEIGFGGGEHLVSDATAHARILFIGCEPFVNGVAKLVSAVDEKKIRNILIHDGDALDVLQALPDASLGRVTILYPDPWPKFGQRKRRFISPETIGQMARTLRDGKEVRFATDIDDYSGWTLARFQSSGSFDWTARNAEDWKIPWSGWPGTRYEAKAFREGRTPAYLTFVRKARG